MAKDSRINLKGAIQAKKGNQRYPVIKVVENDPELAAVISKLHKSRESPGYNDQGNREPQTPDLFRLKELAAKTANNINDSQIAMQMLPDLELAAQILISIILSPKDMMTVEPNFTCGQDITSTELSGKLLGIIKTFFENDYDLKTFLQNALRDMLFETGSYPMIVIPENSVDYAINGYTKFAMESFSEIVDRDGKVKNLGLLGNPSEKLEQAKKPLSISSETFAYHHEVRTQYNPTIEISLENKKYSTGISVVDNFNIFKIPKIMEKSRKLKERDIVEKNNPLNFSLESEINKLELNDRELTALLFKERNHQFKPIQSLKTDFELDRMMLGNPLIMHLPSESVLPVFIPGTPNKQIGFFVLLDNDGNPLDLSASIDSYRELANYMSTNGSFPSAMLNKVKNAMYGGFNCNNMDHLNYVSSVYGEMIEADLLSRLRNGKYTNGVAIAHKEEIYRIMLARSLASKSTQLLWVPESLLTYFAIKYNGNGIGKSMLEDLKIINSLRAMVTMANTMSLLKNSISRTGVRIKLDEKDPNPQKTFETIQHEILRSRQQIIPWGTINPADIADWAARAGLEFITEGHPGLPDVGIEFEDRSSSTVQPNTELMDELRKQTAMGVGLAPEMIDSTLSPEFATSVVTNNIMVSKRAIQIQDVFCPQVMDHIHKVMRNTPSIVNDLLNEIYEDFDNIILTPKLKEKALKDDKIKLLVCKQTLKDFLDSLGFSLPKPDSVSLENQLSALDTMEKMLDKALESYISSDMFNKTTAGALGEQADVIKSVVKAYYMRKWMIENGVLPELAEITTTFEEGEGSDEAYKSQAKLFKGLIKNFAKFFIDMREAKAKGDKVLEILKIKENDSFSSDSSSGGSSEFSTDLDSGDQNFLNDFTGEGGTSETGLETPEETETTETETTSEPSAGTEETGTETPEETTF